MDWLVTFPHLDSLTMGALRRTIDDGFRVFTRAWGDSIETFFEPLRLFLIHSERLLLATPWPIFMLIVAVLGWLSSRRWSIVIGSVLSLAVIGFFGMWEDTMRTVSMTFVCTVVAIVVGIPIGILMSRSNRVQSVFNPILDVMQTMPSFVYLIPVVMLLGIGRVPGVLAVVIYSIPPVIRLTNLGIRLVDRDVLEAA